jgi:hypothetical protein
MCVKFSRFTLVSHLNVFANKKSFFREFNKKFRWLQNSHRVLSFYSHHERIFFHVLFMLVSLVNEWYVVKSKLIYSTSLCREIWKIFFVFCIVKILLSLHLCHVKIIYNFTPFRLNVDHDDLQTSIINAWLIFEWFHIMLKIHAFHLWFEVYLCPSFTFNFYVFQIIPHTNLYQILIQDLKLLFFFFSLHFEGFYYTKDKTILKFYLSPFFLRFYTIALEWQKFFFCVVYVLKGNSDFCSYFITRA